MGGDGGVIASNRRYMRGAGSATHTADEARQKEQNAEKEIPKEIMSTDYLTKTPLHFDRDTVVVCPYGRLYRKEAALEALLRRKTGGDDELGSHIRGMKDLHDFRCEVSQTSKRPICPVTNLELNGSQTAYLICKGKQSAKKASDDNDDDHSSSGVNVLSARALKEMGMETIQSEYGPFDEDDMIQLAPPPSLMQDVMEKVRLRQDVQNAAKKKKKKSKKRKHEGQTDAIEAEKDRKAPSLALDNLQRKTTKSVSKSAALCSLFNKKSKLSQKEKNDNLFAR